MKNAVGRKKRWGWETVNARKNLEVSGKWKKSGVLLVFFARRQYCIESFYSHGGGFLLKSAVERNVVEVV